MDNQTTAEVYGLIVEHDSGQGYIVVDPKDLAKAIDAYYRERFRLMIERARPAYLEEPHDRPMPITEPHYIDGWNEGLGEYIANLLRELEEEEEEWRLIEMRLTELKQSPEEEHD